MKKKILNDLFITFLVILILLLGMCSNDVLGQSRDWTPTTPGCYVSPSIEYEFCVQYIPQIVVAGDY